MTVSGQNTQQVRTELITPENAGVEVRDVHGTTTGLSSITSIGHP